MPAKNRFGFSITDELQDKINSLPRTVKLSPYLVRATNIICDELATNPKLKPENISIFIQKELPLPVEPEPKKTPKKRV